MQGGYGMCFCIHSRNFVELEPFRGTSVIGARNLSPVTKLLASTGAVSRYNVGRSQRFVTVQELNCEQLRVSGCRGHYEFVLVQEAQNL